jgi:hypothetical protein
MVYNPQSEEAAEKGPPLLCHSEVAAATVESLFLFMELSRREIPRFARNDKINYFFRSLFSLRGCVLAWSKTHSLKPAPR